MAYKIWVDREACIGAGPCVDIAPNVFALDDEDICVVIDPSGDSDNDILVAAQDCPMQCIYLFNPATDDQVFP